MILYNGASGGIGRHFAAVAAATANVRAVALQARLEDGDGIEAELAHLEPDASATLVHLAARVSVAACEADPTGATRVNADLAGELVQRACRWASARSVTLRVVYVSTGHVYAPPPAGHRTREDDPLGPASAYARSKLAGERAVANAGRQAQVPVLLARVFGLIGPGQEDHYVLPALIRRVAEDNLTGVPGLDFTRDYLDARDVSLALLRLAASAWPDPATAVNVCSGQPRTIRELLRAVLDVMDPEHAAERAETASSAPGRSTDLAWLVGEPRRFVELTGARPAATELADTVRDAVVAWR